LPIQVSKSWQWLTKTATPAGSDKTTYWKDKADEAYIEDSKDG